MNAKVILITDALTGIGRAAKLVMELRASGAEAENIRADVRIEEEVHNLADQTIKCFGRIDVVVNNAGTEGKPGPLIDQTVESYTTTFPR